MGKPYDVRLMDAIPFPMGEQISCTIITGTRSSPQERKNPLQGILDDKKQF